MENFRKILVPFDFEEQSYIALKQSYNLAKLSGLDITLLYVLEERSNFFEKLFGAENKNDEMIDKIKASLTDFANKASQESGIRITSIVAKGKIYSKIVEMADALQSKFIVMEASSQVFYEGVTKKIVGPVASRVIRTAKCPVITINSAHNNEGCRNILVPIDLTQESRQKVGWAIEMAKLFGSSVKIVSVLWSVNQKEIVHQLKVLVSQVHDFVETHNVKCTSEIIEVNKESEEVPAILKYAKENEVDLIMLMTQKETGFIDFFVDSQTNEIIRLSDIPVMSIVPKNMGENLAR